jgi:putative oxidoreductase
MRPARILSHPALLLLCRLVLGTVFVIAAVPKIAHPDSFATSVEAYELLPLAAVNIAAIIIPWIELICGLFLIAGVYLRPSSALLGVLLGVFIIAITVAVLRGLNINCGCFGESGGATVGWNKVLEDLALLIPALLIFRNAGGVGGRHNGDEAGPAGSP